MIPGPPLRVSGGTSGSDVGWHVEIHAPVVGLVLFEYAAASAMHATAYSAAVA